MKRACRGMTRRGTDCGAAPLTAAGAVKLGLAEREHDYCAAHHPELPASARFGSREQAREAGLLGGRPPLPRPTDVARELVEENVGALLRPYFRTLGFDVVAGPDGLELLPLEHGAVLYGESKEGVVKASAHEDLGAQMAAAERLFDRIYGRPKQQTEVSGPDEGPIVLDVPADATEKSAKAALLLQQLGHVDGPGDR